MAKSGKIEYRIIMHKLFVVRIIIEQLHDDVILLQLPGSLGLLFSCAN